MGDVIWTAVCEILVEPGDLPSGSTKAFVRVATWADSLEAVKDKVARYLETHNWQLLSIEDAGPIGDATNYRDEMADMIVRTRGNRKAIILGHFHSYKEN